MAVMSRAPSAAVALTICLGLLSTLTVQASPACPEQQTSPQVPTNLALCKQLADTTERILRFPCWLMDHRRCFSLDRFDPTCPQCM